MASAVVGIHHNKRNAAAKKPGATRVNLDSGRRKEASDEGTGGCDEDQEKDAGQRLRASASQLFQAVGQTIITSVGLGKGDKGDAAQDCSQDAGIDDTNGATKPRDKSDSHELARQPESDKSLPSSEKLNNFITLMKDGDALRANSMYPTYAYLDKEGTTHDRSKIPKGTRFFTFLANVLASHWFDIFMGGVIVANLVVISLHQKSRLENESGRLYDDLEHVFLSIYVLEVVARIYIWGLACLRTGFAVFDFCIVLVGVIVTWFIKPIFGDVDVGPLFILRIARLMRLVRALRVLVIFRELWMLVRGLLSSFRTMVYTVLLLATMLYAFASIGIELLTRHPLAVSDDYDVVFREIVLEFFNDLPTAMLTLVQFVTFDNVVYIYTPLIKADWRLLPFFGSVLLVVGIVLMNLVTAVIVNSALEQANQDKDLIASVEEEKKKKMVKTMRKIFERLDEDKSGQISRVEIQAIDEADREHLASLMGISDPLEIFDSLDVDGDEEIGIDEFCDGIWHVCISNTPIHVKRMEKQLDRILQQVRDTQDHQLEFEKKIDKKIDKVLLQVGKNLRLSDPGKTNGAHSNSQASASFLPQTLKMKENSDLPPTPDLERNQKSWKELAEEGGMSEEDAFGAEIGDVDMPVWAHALIHEMHEVCRAAREVCWRDKMSRGTKDLKHSKTSGGRRRGGAMTQLNEDVGTLPARQTTPKQGGGPSPDQSSSTDGSECLPKVLAESGAQDARTGGARTSGCIPERQKGEPIESSRRVAMPRTPLREVSEASSNASDWAVPEVPPSSAQRQPSSGLYSSSEVPNGPPVADEVELARRRCNL